MCETALDASYDDLVYSAQLSEHVRTQVLTPQCPHLFNTTTYETSHLLLHVLIYLQLRSVGEFEMNLFVGPPAPLSHA